MNFYAVDDFMTLWTKIVALGYENNQQIRVVNIDFSRN
jgi:hypothetical protein